MAEGIYIAKRTGHCQHCGHRFFSSAPVPGPLCYHCESAGITVSASDSTFTNVKVEQPITYYGQPVDAPGFTQNQFDQAMARAFCDDLQVTPYHDGRHIVHHVGLASGYVVTRTSCDCQAGIAGTACKHRAFLIACLDVREPHVRHAWATLNAERPARKAVAA